MEEPSTFITFFAIVISALFGAFCFQLAKKRGRNEKVWGVLGFLFGFMALITLFFLPAKKKPIKARIKETSAHISSMENKGAEALSGDEAFDVPRAPRISGSKSLTWHFIDSTEDNSIKGPLAIDELRKEIHAKNLDASTYIWCEEFEEWTQICDFSNASLLLDTDYIE